jgi:nickel-dependent lactate racemase
MNIHLAYGKTGLAVELPDEWDVSVIEPLFAPGLPDPQAALQAALRRPTGLAPLAALVQPADRVGIVFSDLTRPTPNHLILPAILAELAGLPAENITLFNALGTHRPNTEAELRGMLGDAVVDRYRIVQNDAFERATQVCLGKTASGNQVWVNREFAECDWKVLTGFIEPHLFAGYSGGGKAVLPGMAGQATVLNNHNVPMIADPRAAWGVFDNNPIAAEIRQAAEMVGRSFLVNVTLNKHKEITAVFAGELEAAHAAGRAFVRQTAMAPVPHAFDIVITTNSGYPLDLNLYQSVKGMSAAAQVVRPGGAIVIATECWDGLPDHGLYSQLMREAASPQDILARINTPGFLKQDQWQLQIQSQIQLKAEVYVYSGYLSDEQIRMAFFHPCHDIRATVAALAERFGPDARICVLPEGPQTIPYIEAVEGETALQGQAGGS